MVDLVLDDLGRPAGKGADARLAVGSFVLHLDAFPALGGAHTLQRKTALLGVVGAGLFEDDRVEQHQIPVLGFHGDDALGYADHVGGHAHAAVGVGGQGLQQVAGRVGVCRGGPGGLLG